MWVLHEERTKIQKKTYVLILEDCSGVGVAQ